MFSAGHNKEGKKEDYKLGHYHTMEENHNDFCQECGRPLPAADENNNNNDDDTQDTEISTLTVDPGNNEDRPNKNNWIRRAGWIMAGAGATVGLVAAVPVVMGFGSAGIVGGSVAAGIQSGIGNVAAGSMFATLQSLGATGTLMTGVYGGGAATAAGLGATRLGTNANNNGNNNNQNDTNQKDPPGRNEAVDPANNHDGVCRTCGRAGALGRDPPANLSML